MNIINYVPIDKVLYDLSLTIPESSWNETKFREWAHAGAIKIAPETIFQDYTSLAVLNNHKALMPVGYKYINQIMINTNQDRSDLLVDIVRTLNLENAEDNPALNAMDNPELLPARVMDAYRESNHWEPLKRTSSTFMKAIHCVDDFWECPSCKYEYSVSANGIITSTAKTGYILISYKSYPRTEEGVLLVPDHPDFLEAVHHYVLMKYHSSQVLLNNEGSYRERDWHLKRFATLSMKAKSLNLPDLDTLENIKNEQTRLIPKTDRYDQAFIGLGSSEHITH